MIAVEIGDASDGPSSSKNPPLRTFMIYPAAAQRAS